MNYGELAQKFEGFLGLEHHAVAIAFLDTAPPNVTRVKASGPASCAYWKTASEGAVFYTTSEDHLNCTIGAYTHGVTLPVDKADELKSTMGQMIGLSYLREDEIPQIPHRKEAFEVAVYAPLGQSPCKPDVVVVRGNAKSAMLLIEAALAAGIAFDQRIMARPTCAFLPQTLEFGSLTPSFGCIGNRVYTGLEDSELYFAIPGSKVAEISQELEKIVKANQALESFHQSRCACA